MRTTERDRRIIEFLFEFEVADTDQIRRMFFPTQSQGKLLARRAMRRVIELEPEIKREEWVTGRNVFYLKKAQLKHKLLITEFYSRLMTGPGRILEWDRHPSFGSTRVVRPDLFIAYEYAKKAYLFFLEAQISANPLNLEKYERLKASGECDLPAFPRVVVISYREPRVKSSFKVVWLPVDFAGFERVFVN